MWILYFYIGGLSEKLLEKKLQPILSVQSALATIVILQMVVFFTVGVAVACKYSRKKELCPEKQQSQITEKKDELYEIIDNNVPLRPPAVKETIHYEKNIAYA